jgi:catechol 2,3-dioxygenase-like lactoylglutathione lyase family enzyme
MFATFMIGLATGRVMRPGEAWAAQATTPANPYAKMLHVGILVDDLEEAVDRWRDMGFTDIRVLPPSKGVERLYHGKPIDVTLKQAFIHGTEPMIELMEPVEDTASPWRDYRAKHGEVIHHLAYRLPDTSTELEKFRKLGLHELAQGKWPEGDSHWGTFHYVQDPDGGVIIEFISRITRR